MRSYELDKNIDYIVDELHAKHGCHTIILYGSRARGDAKPSSDYDILGVRESGDSFRDARFWNGHYLDIFVYPEVKLSSADETMLHLRDGVVLREKGNIGTHFLQRLAEIDRAGPKRLAEDEIQARKVWAEKMLARARDEDIEGNFRRAWLLTALLEDYFLIRGQWYRGPKESFTWLKDNEPEIYQAFERALQPGAPFESLEKLVKKLK